MTSTRVEVLFLVLWKKMYVHPFQTIKDTDIISTKYLQSNKSKRNLLVLIGQMDKIFIKLFLIVVFYI